MYHNIRLYPFDTDEDDEEEVQLNESIRVSVSIVRKLMRRAEFFVRISFLLRLLAQKTT